MDYTAFDFGAFRTFKGIDFLGAIIGLAKAYNNLDPITDESIHIQICSSISSEDGIQLLSNMLQSGTKPLNAIVYMQTRNMEGYDTAFKITKVENATIENQVKSIKLVLAAVLTYISRGQLPAAQSLQIRTPLPKFMRATLGIKAKDEVELRKLLMDFDPKHISMSKIFSSPDNFAGWEEIVGNRLLLGVAGHKPLKAVKELYPFITVLGDDDKGKIIGILHEASKDLNRGFYPSLHPGVQSFSKKYPNFYKTTLKLLFDKMSGDVISKQAKLLNLGMFKSDKFVKDEILHYNPDIRSWDINSMKDSLGEIIIFGESKGDITIHKKLEYSKGKVQDGADEEEIEKDDDDQFSDDKSQKSVGTKSGSTVKSNSSVPKTGVPGKYSQSFS